MISPFVRRPENTTVLVSTLSLRADGKAWPDTALLDAMNASSRESELYDEVKGSSWRQVPAWLRIIMLIQIFNDWQKRPVDY